MVLEVGNPEAARGVWDPFWYRFGGLGVSLGGVPGVLFPCLIFEAARGGLWEPSGR